MLAVSHKSVIWVQADPKNEKLGNAAAQKNHKSQLINNHLKKIVVLVPSKMFNQLVRWLVGDKLGP